MRLLDASEHLGSQQGSEMLSLFGPEQTVDGHQVVRHLPLALRLIVGMAFDQQVDPFPGDIWIDDRLRQVLLDGPGSLPVGMTFMAHRASQLRKTRPLRIIQTKLVHQAPLSVRLDNTLTCFDRFTRPKSKDVLSASDRPRTDAMSVLLTCGRILSLHGFHSSRRQWCQTPR